MKKLFYRTASSLLATTFLFLTPSVFAKETQTNYTPFSVQVGGTGGTTVGEVKENLEIPDVVQSTGQSETAVMSQKAVTDAISSGSGGGIVVTQDTGQSSTNVMSQKASTDTFIAQNNISQTTGQSETAVMSQKAVTDSIAAVSRNTVVQTTGNSITDVMSQKAVTDAINSVPQTSIIHTTGQSTTEVMSQKAVTDAILTSQNIFDMIYPIGAVYISVNYLDPGSVFGGTWEQIQDKFLLSAGNSYSVNDIGGNESISLSTANIPNHTHSFSATTSSTGSHTHSFSATTSSDGSHMHNVGRDYDGGSGSNRYTVHNTGSSGAGGQSPTSSSGSHNHTVSGTSGSSGTHTHTVSGTTGSVGNGEKFNIMPPYLVVYMWQRTA